MIFGFDAAFFYKPEQIIFSNLANKITVCRFDERKKYQRKSRLSLHYNYTIKVVLFYLKRVNINMYLKVPKFSDARNFAIMYLKFKKRGQTFAYFFKKMQME